jgi:hypothetical protein
MKLTSLFSSATSELEAQLLKDTTALALPKGRRVGQPGNFEARLYLKKRLEELGLETFKSESYTFPYRGVIPGIDAAHTFENIVGVVPGKDRSLAPILIGAHYDSIIDAPCADDNATAVAMNLAIAEMVLKNPLERDLIVAFFDAEEPPYFLTEQMGSTRFYTDHCKNQDFAAVIVSDLIGHDFCISDFFAIPKLMKPLTKGLEKLVFMTGAESHELFPEIVKQVAKNHEEVKLFPTLTKNIGSMSDYHIFEKNGHPILFFSCAQGKYYHHEKDDIDWINFAKLAHLSNLLEDIIRQIDVHSKGEQKNLEDTFQFEFEMIKKSIGPKKLAILFKALGIKEPSSRAELNQLVEALISAAI